MAKIAARELRNDTAGLLRRVAAGEDVVITVRGEPVAELRPLRGAVRTWVRREDFVSRLAPAQADPGLREDLEELAGDTLADLDDLP